jgi:hypothetical protein
MVYVSARPTHGTDVFVGDTAELAEVRWVTFAEVDELMGGTIYEPVRAHLRNTLTDGTDLKPGRGTVPAIQAHASLIVSNRQTAGGISPIIPRKSY